MFARDGSALICPKFETLRTISQIVYRPHRPICRLVRCRDRPNWVALDHLQKMLRPSPQPLRIHGAADERGLED